MNTQNKDNSRPNRSYHAPDGGLPPIIAMSSGVWTSAMIIGPATSGFLYSVHPAVAYGTTAALIVFGIFGIMRVQFLRPPAVRDPDETFGLAIRAYAPTPRHAERHLEACLSLRDEHGTPVPGYGWMFPAGDGTVNIGVGALSTMKGFKKLNLNTLLDQYASIVREPWSLGDYVDKPRAWRLPMSCVRRHGPGWVAVGDAAGFVNPMNGEGIDYALESGMLAVQCFIDNPATAPSAYDTQVGERFDAFLRTGRRFSFIIGHPWLLRPGLRVAVGTQAAADITLAVMGNLIDSTTPGAAGKVMRLADNALRIADPILRRTRAKA